MLSVAVARSFSDGRVIRYVLPVLWMTSCIHIMQGIRQNQRRRVCFVQFAMWRHRVRSLPSSTAFCFSGIVGVLLLPAFWCIKNEHMSFWVPSRGILQNSGPGFVPHVIPWIILRAKFSMETPWDFMWSTSWNFHGTPRTSVKYSTWNPMEFPWKISHVKYSVDFRGI